MTKPNTKTTPVVDARFRARFWDKVNRSGRVVRAELGPCWEWTASLDKHGYGQFRVEPATHRAHRIAWLILHGSWPDGFCLHECDNTLCVNPEHLTVGTQAQNLGDMARRGRHANLKLTPEQVRIIRANTNRHRAAAVCFGVNRGLISAIRTRKIWRHVA